MIAVLLYYILVWIIAILCLLLFAFNLKLISNLIYLFQIKEYRFDRAFSFSKERNILVYLFFNFELNLPAKSIRNILIFIFVFFEYLAIFILLKDYCYEEFLNKTFFHIIAFEIFCIIAIGILLPIMVMIAVTITSPLAKYTRNKKIKQAKTLWDKQKPKCIMITGSYGKSSVKEIIYDIFDSKYITGKTEKNMNTDIGVAISFIKSLSKNEKLTHFITEVGAYKRGEINDICKNFKPNSVIITAFGNQHIDLYGSKENLILAESEPLDFLNAGDTVYINMDILEYENIKNKYSHLRFITISTKNHNADYFIDKISSGEWGSRGEIKTKNSVFIVETSLLGYYVISNIALCIACAINNGIEIQKIQEKIEEMKPILHKLSLENGLNNALILDDSYNSNVEGFIEAIKITNTISRNNKYILSRGIIELGNEKENSYKRIIGALDQTEVKLITTDKIFLKIAIHDKRNIIYFDSEDKLWSYIKEKCNSDCVITIEGRWKEKDIEKIVSSDF